MEMLNKNIVILMDMPLFPYRIYAYNELVERGYNLTVISVSNKIDRYDIPLLFQHRVLGSKRIGPFVKLQNFNIHDYTSFDIIIIDPNLRVIDYYLFYNNKYRNRLIVWGHLTGRTSNNKFAEKVRFRFFKKFLALVFYDSVTRNEYIAHGFNPQKLFVANNTQYVDPQTIHPNEERKYFLYVGRIQDRKGLELAIKAFSELKVHYSDPTLEFVFVGGGDVEKLERLTKELSLKQSIRFVGPVHEQAQLGMWFSGAIAYVSPGHVGLGVLHSFACGVPVITCTGRLHSVEISNCNPDNSIIVPYTSIDVAKAMEKLYTDQVFQRKLSQNAYHYYWNCCTIDKMVDGVDNAIKYLSSINRYD